MYDSVDKCREEADAVVDFSRPEALSSLLRYSVGNDAGLVIGTTVFSDEGISQIRTASGEIPVFMSPNMSLGIMLLMKLVRDACLFLGEGFDIEIVNMHHRQKVDSPSGTSMEIA